MVKIRVQWYVGAERHDWLRVYEMPWRSSWTTGKTQGRKLLIEQTMDKEGNEVGDPRKTKLCGKRYEKHKARVEYLIRLMVENRGDDFAINSIDVELR